MGIPLCNLLRVEVDLDYVCHSIIWSSDTVLPYSDTLRNLSYLYKVYTLLTFIHTGLLYESSLPHFYRCLGNFKDGGSVFQIKDVEKVDPTGTLKVPLLVLFKQKIKNRRNRRITKMGVVTFHVKSKNGAWENLVTVRYLSGVRSEESLFCNALFFLFISISFRRKCWRRRWDLLRVNTGSMYFPGRPGRWRIFWVVNRLWRTHSGQV